MSASEDDPTLPPVPFREELLALATEFHPRAVGWTRAGRSLQKHGYRPESVYPRVTGPPSHYNATAQRIVATILRDPQTVMVQRSRQRYGQPEACLEVVAADGRILDFRWVPAGETFLFVGFREPLASRRR